MGINQLQFSMPLNIVYFFQIKLRTITLATHQDNSCLLLEVAKKYWFKAKNGEWRQSNSKTFHAQLF